MINPVSKSESIPPEGVQFFTPVSVGILVQLFCAGLVIAVTAAMSLSSAPRAVPVASVDAPAANLVRDDSTEPAAPGAELNNSTPANDPVNAAAKTPAADNESELATNKDAAQIAANDVASNGAPAAGPAATDPPAIDPPATELAATDGSPSGLSPDKAGAEESAVTTAVRALDDVRKRGRKLPLAGRGLSDEIELCKIFVQDPATVTLELIGSEFTVPEEVTLALKPLPVDPKSFLWKVSQESKTGLARDQEIGEFLLKDQQLSFRWFRNMDMGKLPFCRLRISVGPDSELCDLWVAARSGAAKVRFAKAQQRMDEFVPTGIRLPPFEILELDMTLVNWPAHSLSADKLTFNETVSVTFRDDESDRDLMKLEFLLDKKDGRYGLRGEYTFNAPVPPSTRRPVGVRYEEKELTLDQLKKTSDAIESSVRKSEKELGSVQQSLTLLEKQKEELMEQTSNGPNSIQRGILAKLTTQIAARVTEEQELLDTLEALETATKTMEKVNSLCEEIGNDGQIQYRLFRPFAGDGGDIEIAATVTEAAGVEEAR